MNYNDAWNELKDRIAQAETSLLVTRNRGGAPQAEKMRIDAKLEGLRVAKEYMRQIDCVALSEKS